MMVRRTVVPVLALLLAVFGSAALVLAPAAQARGLTRAAGVHAGVGHAGVAYGTRGVYRSGTVVYGSSQGTTSSDGSTSSPTPPASGTSESGTSGYAAGGVVVHRSGAVVHQTGVARAGRGVGVRR